MDVLCYVLYEDLRALFHSMVFSNFSQKNQALDNPELDSNILNIPKTRDYKLILSPGPIVEQTDALIIYLPFAACGFAF